ncbi:DUF4185 domain-containing protein [Lederbergia graminis]|uniref:DUF4185 domain-containing protein n=1 Tax=Lederbergia graminis TaxID=735518 RepID=A0ABW0LFK3_9BACI
MNSKKRRSIGSMIVLIIMIVSLAIPPFPSPSFAVTQQDLPESTTQQELPEKFELTATKAETIARVTGPTLEGETIPNPNQTHERWGLRATDLGVIWDATTDPEDKKVMIAFGDSYDDGWGGFGGGGGGWRSNLLALSHDTDLSDGLAFSSMITEEGRDDYAKEILFSEKNTSGNGDFTVIPNAGVTVGDRHYIHYFQLRTWDGWTINHAGIAYSDDEGQNWTYSDVQWDGDSNFGFASFIKEDGYVYMVGARTGRNHAAHLARVPEEDMLVKESYEYWNGSEWVNDESASAVIVDAPISEMSIMYNSYYDKYILMYLNVNSYAMVIRSSDHLTHGWSDEVVVATGAEHPQLYGGYMHPWSMDGKDLYFVMSLWGPYNVVLMHSTLDAQKVRDEVNLLSDPSFEEQTTNEVSAPWQLEGEKEGGIDLHGLAYSGNKNLYLRHEAGWNAFTQTVDVEPNTDYKFEGWVRTSGNNTAGYFGVRDASGGIMSEVQFGSHGGYEKLTVRFNSGDNNKVTIFTGMHAVNGDTWIQADAYKLTETDINPPVITLNGDETIEVPVGDTFVDPGATAIDEFDGDLSEKIQVSGEVDTNFIGTYTLTYDVTDSDGNKAETVTRTIIVTGDDYTVSNAKFQDEEGNEISKLPKKGLVTASVDVRNNTKEEQTVTVVVGLYDKKGKLVNISGLTQAVPSGNTETITGGFMMPGNNSGYEIRIFVAESLTNLDAPLSNIASLGQK